MQAIDVDKEEGRLTDPGDEMVAPTEWETTFLKLVETKEDAIWENFRWYSYIMRAATSLFVIVPGLVAALWVGVTELYAAANAPNPGYRLGYVSGPSSFGLAIAIVLVPYTLKGELFTSLPKSDQKGELKDILKKRLFDAGLQHNRMDTNSYYEILDVLTKYILHEWKREETDGTIVIKKNKDGKDRMVEVRSWVIMMNAAIGVMTVLGIGLGCMLFYFAQKNLRPDDTDDFKKFMYKGWIWQWCSMSQLVMYAAAAFIMSCAICTLYLAAFLHRKHTKIFVRLLRKEGHADIFNNSRFRNISEKYLMLQYLFQKSSSCWSPLLSVWIMLTGGLFIMGAIVCMVLDDPYMKKMAILVSGFNFLLFIIPICLLAYANGFVDHIIGTIQQATWEDFKVIGGRDKWLEYIKTNPTYWFTLGFAVTKAWVLGFISGALSTFGAVAIQKLADGKK